MNAIVGFLPWIVFWILIGPVSFRAAVSIAFALTILGALLPRLRGRRLKTLELGGVVVFGVLMIVAFATDDEFLERWIQPLTNGGLLLVALIGVLVGRPFTLDYAREAVTPEVARLPGFLYINRIITWVWIAAFAVMTVASLLPPIIEGDATLHDDGSTLSVVGYWVIPFTVLGLAGLFSTRFPDWFTARMEAPSAQPRRASAAAVEHAEPLPAATAGELRLAAEPARAERQGADDRPLRRGARRGGRGRGADARCIRAAVALACRPDGGR